ncbi:MAG: hypothetical protein WC004_00340 [Candidatus Absconditabacterales bacterium]
MTAVKKHTIIVLSIVCLVGAISVFSQEEYRNDCNLTLQDSMADDFGFFTKDDIQKAYANMRTNCPSMTPDETVPQSPYMFDQLIRIGLQKLRGEAEELGLQSATDGLAFKELVEKSIAAANSQDVTIPSALQEEYNNIRNRNGSYNTSKAKNEGIYEGSTGLYVRYLALCDLAWGITFNPSVVNTVAGTKVVAINNRYNTCIEDIEKIIVPAQQNIVNTSTQVVNEQTKVSLQESMNTYSKSELDAIIETTNNAKNNFVDVSKKASAGGAMKNCNPGS